MILLAEKIIAEAEAMVERGWFVYKKLNAADLLPILSRWKWLFNQVEHSSCLEALAVVEQLGAWLLHRVFVASHKEKFRRDIERNQDKLRRYLAERDGYFCQACGSVADLEIDHIFPLDLGGTNKLSNLQLLCHRENAIKSNKVFV